MSDFADFAGFTPHQLAAAADVLSRWEPADEADIELVRPITIYLRRLAEAGHREVLDNIASVEEPSPLSLHLSYEPAKEPPSCGADWPEEQDYPGVRAEVRLPVEWRRLPAEEGAGDLRSDLRQPLEQCCEEPLHWDWGTQYCGKHGEDRCTYRFRARVFRHSTLEAAEAAARAWHAEGAKVIADLLAARNTRLAQRAVTIAAAHARPGTLPAEVLAAIA